MKAVMKVATGVGHVELRDIAEPAPGPGQVLIRVKAAGICGTDLHIYHDEFKTVPPVVLGHEVAGEICGARPWCFRHRRRQTRDHGNLLLDLRPMSLLPRRPDQSLPVAQVHRFGRQRRLHPIRSRAGRQHPYPARQQSTLRPAR